MHLSIRGRHVDAGPPFPPPLLCRSANIITASPYASGAETLIIRTTTALSLHARSGLAMATNDSSLGIPLPAVFPPNHNAGRSVLILVWILFGASTALVAARIYSKIAILTRFATDDVLMSLSWASTLVYSVAIQLSYHYGLGRHYEYLTIQTSFLLLKWAYVAFAFCIVGPLAGRVSFTLYLLSIIGNARHGIRYWLWSLAALQTVMNVTLLTVTYSICGTDVAIIGIPSTTCFQPSPLSRFSLSAGAVNVATDAFLTFAPTLLVLRLKTTSKAKSAAITLLSLSSVAMIAAIYRTIELRTVFLRNNWDFTCKDDVIPYFAAATVEQNIIIIAASVPTVAPIFKSLKRRYGSTLSSSNASASSRQLSHDSAEIQHNMAKALGMNMPMLGNSVTITAGRAAKDSQEHILPLQELPAIKTTKQTRIEYIERDDG
ncbi:hypothetical protein LTR54_007208 [Friedmanniomyces endolithicus]|uniref:Rhodopsin domain-containing protein n=1 Tax=Friedmanniomyces endolithicus TaxID=329885 RepID=A0AAN6FJV0_9PEZI|nr:hypothetical protein LTR82_009299 [Friedmanniomyces endolithicus]KAK1004887.1 hypothetical protein LTR54_007208 [Friedmanniomyces endolithicus]